MFSQRLPKAEKWGRSWNAGIQYWQIGSASAECQMGPL